MRPMALFVAGVVSGGAAVFLAMRPHEPQPVPVRAAVEASMPASARSGEEAATATAKVPTPTPTQPPLDQESVAATEVRLAPQPVQLAPEFERLFKEGRTAPNTHAQFLKQPQDSARDIATEEQWRQYYAGKPDVLQYGVPEVQCRSAMCEVRLLANATMSGEEWMKLMTGTSQSAYPTFPGSMAGGDVLAENGVTAVVFYFAKRR